MSDEFENITEDELSTIQKEIFRSIEQQSGKALLTEALIAKKIRDNLKIEGKQKAGLGMMDIEKVVVALRQKELFYSVHLNSANDILLKKEEETKLLELDARHRRLSCEKSMSILSSGDLTSKKNNKPKSKGKRTESRKLNVRDFDFE